MLKKILFICCFYNITNENIYAAIPEKIIMLSKKLSKVSFHEKILKYSKILKNIPYGQPSYAIEDVKNENNVKNIIMLLSKPEFTYDFDKLDCVTFLETLFALSLTEVHNINNFKKYEDIFKTNFENNLKKIRYKNFKDIFFERNHFTSIDWLPNNSFFLEDITEKIYPDSKIAKCEIHKFEWFLNYKPIKEYLLRFKEENLYYKIKDIFKTSGYDTEVIMASTPYIPIKTFIKMYKKFYENLPNLGIVCIIRPNWNLKQLIGTNLNISHLGLFIKKNDKKIIFRHSTSLNEQGVIDIDLISYLKKYMSSSTIKGISIIKIKNIR